MKNARLRLAFVGKPCFPTSIRDRGPRWDTVDGGHVRVRPLRLGCPRSEGDRQRETSDCPEAEDLDVAASGGVGGARVPAKIAATGGVAPKHWSVHGKLARGVKLGKATGALSGVAHGAGTYRITVRVTDRLSASATKALELVVG